MKEGAAVNTDQKPSFSLRQNRYSVPELSAGLYLVSTPIGNLGDITIRALETLAACTVIACEDTRTSGVLLKKFGIDRPKISYNEHNADKRGPDILRQISNGAAIAVISDAGTPLVSDPGFRLAKEAIALDLPVIPIPGASAPMAALVGSGLYSTDFRFCGFLPNKSQARMKFLQALNTASETLIFFENPGRLVKALADMCEAFGEDRLAVVARELTKMHETFHRGTLAQLLNEFTASDKVRGEIVVLIEGNLGNQENIQDPVELLKTALETMKTKQASNHVSEITGLAKQDVYRMALDLIAADKAADKDDG